MVVRGRGWGVVLRDSSLIMTGVVSSAGSASSELLVDMSAVLIFGIILDF